MYSDMIDFHIINNLPKLLTYSQVACRSILRILFDGDSENSMFEVSNKRTELSLFVSTEPMD